MVAQVMIPEKFDVIIVGAGPAGITAALVLAQEGIKVALFERGEQPGVKNMFGGVMYYSDALNKLLPDFWKEAPIERYITRHTITFLKSTSSVSVSLKDDEFGQPPYNGFTLLRAKFDQWYAEKAQEAGAFLIPQTVVDDLVWDSNKVIGIKARRNEGIVYADAVIVADGVNSLLAKKAGLRKKFTGTSFSVAAKELLTLPAEVIEERFGLSGDEGIAQTFVGACTQGLEGGAFLYTNKNSLSIGTVAKLSSLQEKKISIFDILEDFKSNSFIKQAIRGAHLKEYSGHLIPEGGVNMVPELCGNGILLVGDAAGFLLSTGINLEGMNFAIASGFAAGEALKIASQIGDFSKKGLAAYKDLLNKNFVLQDLKTFRHTPSLMANSRIYETYPSLVCGVAKKIFQVNGHPKRKFMSLVKEEMKGKISMWHLAKDLIQAGRSLLW